MPGMTWNAVTVSAVPVSYMSLWIAQCDMKDTRNAIVQRRVGQRGVVEGELRRGQRGQREVPEQRHGLAPAAGEVPPGGQPGRHGGDLAAADGQPASVEIAAERQRHRLLPVPGADEGGALVRQQGQRTGE